MWIDTLEEQLGHLAAMHRDDPEATRRGWAGLFEEGQRADSEIEGTFHAAEDAFLRAQPGFDWFRADFTTRREALFAEEVVTCAEE